MVAVVAVVEGWGGVGERGRTEEREGDTESRR